jgi:hypothetical protein
MITRQPRTTIRPPVTRHFEFTRLQDQLIASAYHFLIPVMARPLGRTRSPAGDHEPAAATTQELRTKARGA